MRCPSHGKVCPGGRGYRYKIDLGALGLVQSLGLTELFRNQAATLGFTVQSLLVVKGCQRLIRRIDQQIGLIKSATDLGISRSSWVWMDEAGAYWVPIKYGPQPIELKKGMFAIECKDINDASNALETVRQMVLNDTLDLQLAQASAEIRARFRGGDAGHSAVRSDGECLVYQRLA